MFNGQVFHRFPMIVRIDEPELMGGEEGEVGGGGEGCWELRPSTMVE